MQYRKKEILHMKNLQNPMVNKLVEIIDSERLVDEIKFEKLTNPPTYVDYHLSDGTFERLNLEMTKDEFKQSLRSLKSWWNIIHKMKIQDVEIE
jgi:hypothetical protein